MHQITIYDEENEVDTSIDDNAPESVTRAWKKAKQIKKAIRQKNNVEDIGLKQEGHFKCPICEKVFYISSTKDWIYKVRACGNIFNYQCSYTCTEKAKKILDNKKYITHR